MIFRIAALGIGALAMYYFDPESGKRRRAQLREKLGYEDLRERAKGIVAEARSAIRERRRKQRAAPDRRDPLRPVDLDRS